MNKSLYFLFSVLIAASPLAAQSGTWKVDPAHSSAQFAVRHMSISTVRGTFNKVSGTAQYDASDPSKDVVDVTIDTASVDTRVDMRDNDLRSDHWFDAQKYPTITFRSKHTEAVGSDKLKITGDLTIHGVTKEAVLDVDGPTKSVNDGRGHLHMGASATTKVDRTQYGMTGFQGMVGNDIVITIDVELLQDAPAGAK